LMLWNYRHIRIIFQCIKQDRVAGNVLQSLSDDE
jgi:hypothetical protein